MKSKQVKMILDKDQQGNLVMSYGHGNLPKKENEEHLQ